MKKEEIFSIPNILSYMRLLLIPFFIYTYYLEVNEPIRIYTAIILVISSISDFLDGFIARRFHMITNLGRLIDPIVDKFYQLIMSILLVNTYPLFYLPLIFMIIENSILLFVGLYLYRETKTHIKQAKLPGKITTAYYFILSNIMLCVDLSHYWITNLLIIILSLLIVIATIYYSYELLQLKKQRLRT